jgi:hypothetical protein
MKQRIEIDTFPHDFQKKNLVTISDRTGHYDLLKCSKCGIEGKRFGLGQMLTLTKDYSENIIKNCDGTDQEIITFYGRKIQITKCYAQGKQFENLTSCSFHWVIPAPSPYKDDLKGVWVMGISEPVKVLNNEYVLIPKIEKSKRLKR